MQLKICKLKSLESTNNYAYEFGANNEVTIHSPLLFYSPIQTKGKGQAQNKWESEPNKNITLSTVFNSKVISPHRVFEINKFFAISIFDFLQNEIPEKHLLKIKWPNDIYFKNKKIAGILIENSIQNNQFKYSVAGAGININQTEFSSNLPNPVSLKQITGKEYNIDNLIEIYSEVFVKYYQMLINQNFDVLNERFLQHLYLINKKAKFILNQEVVEAKIKGINPQGLIIIEHQNMQTKEYNFKQIKYIIEDAPLG